MKDQTASRSATTGQKREGRKLLNEALDELGLNFDQYSKLLSKGGAFKGKVKDAARQLLSSDLLEFVSTATIDPIDRFSVEDVVKSGKIGETKFWFGPNFKRIFGNLVETNIPAATLKFDRLKKGSVDGPIMEELGGASQIKAFVAYIFTLCCRQGQGQEGVLLTNGYANIFYVPDPNNPEICWAVLCSLPLVLLGRPVVRRSLSGYVSARVAR
ncbi:MAG: hypothetical protein WC536_04785 [Patescibacteria group bacterium]